MSVHVTCESRSVHTEDSSSKTGGVCFMDGKRWWPTYEEVEDSHVYDVEEPVSWVIGIHLLHSVTEEGIHLPSATEMRSCGCFRCSYVGLFKEQKSAVFKIASSFSCSWYVNINSLTLVCQWRCRSVSRGWVWRCGGRCWGWGGRQTGTPPAGLGSHTQRTLSYTHTGTSKRNRCCSLLGGRNKWQMSLLFTQIWLRTREPHSLLI